MTFLRIAGRVQTDTGGEMTIDPAELYEEWRQLLSEKLGVRVDGPLLTRTDGRQLQIVRYRAADVVDIPLANLRSSVKLRRGYRRIIIGAGRHDFTSLHSPAIYVSHTWAQCQFDWERIWAQYFCAYSMLKKHGGLAYRGRVHLAVDGWHACWGSTARYGAVGSRLHGDIVDLTSPLTRLWRGGLDPFSSLPPGWR
jgi:hypothetical protein